MKKNIFIVSLLIASLFSLRFFLGEKKTQVEKKLEPKPLLNMKDQEVKKQEYSEFKNKVETEKPVVFSKEDISPEGFNYIHYDFARFISKTVYVHNYDDVIKEESALEKRELLKEYLKSLQSIKKVDFEKWEKIHQKSFLLNSYHAFLIEFMMGKNFKSLSDGDLKQKESIKIFEQSYSFESYIQREILKRFPDRSIVLSLHCFSEDCPEYRNRIYNYKNVDQELIVSVNRYFRHPNKVVYDEEKKQIIMPAYIKGFKKFFPQGQKDWIEYLKTIFLDKSKERELLDKNELKIIF